MKAVKAAQAEAVTGEQEGSIEAAQPVETVEEAETAEEAAPAASHVEL